MVSLIQSIDTGHEDMIHAAEVDYYGCKLATCSSDRSIKVYDLKNGNALIDELKGHFGPVWGIDWSHPKYGSLLASCSYDKRVIIWSDSNGKWSKYYEYANHDSSINSVRFAPAEFGLKFACGSSDGSVSVVSYIRENNTWDAKKIQNAHAIGCNTISWSPAIYPETAFDNQTEEPPKLLLATGGCDNLIKIWKEEQDRWVEVCKLEVHSDWIRDVAWAPTPGLNRYMIASCSQDRRVIIWSSDDAISWNSTVLNTFEDVTWTVSWSLNGNVLAVSGGDSKTSFWKQSLEGNWQCINDLKGSVQNN